MLIPILATRRSGALGFAFGGAGAAPWHHRAAHWPARWAHVVAGYDRAARWAPAVAGHDGAAATPTAASGTTTAALIAVPSSLSLPEALHFAERFLRSVGDPEAASCAAHLVAHAAGELGSKAVPRLRKRLELLAGAQGAGAPPIGEGVAAALGALLERRRQREPVQYILGEVRATLAAACLVCLAA